LKSLVNDDAPRPGLVEIVAEPVVSEGKAAGAGGFAGDEGATILARRDTVNFLEDAREVKGARIAEGFGDFGERLVAALEHTGGSLDAEELTAADRTLAELAAEEAAKVLRSDACGAGDRTEIEARVAP
jgi:hypothetical protein